MENKKTYPEIEKLKKIKDDSQKLGLFLDWICSQNIVLCEMHEHSENCKYEEGENECGYREGEYYPTRQTIEQLLATYFQIDLKKVEEEKREILEGLK